VNVREYRVSDAEELIRLIAGLRITLDGFKAARAEPDLMAARGELDEFLRNGYSIHVAEMDGVGLAGFIVCRTVDGVTWAESLYVDEPRRRLGVGRALFAKAEEVARIGGQDTLYAWVHPNNEGILGFLKAHEYDVLNLIEIRKPHEGEMPGQRVRVMSNEFRY